MIEENQDLNLETDHLEEVIESPPPAQPVVVIQYRTRGVPWYLALPLLVLVPLGAVAVYHRVSSRVRYPLVPRPSADQSTRKAAERQAVPGALSEASVNAALQGLPSASIVDFGAPLALNSQPIAPGSLPAVLPAPAAKADLTKPASPAAATPAATKEGEPSKSAGSSDLAKAAPGVTVASTPPPAATLVKEPGPQAAATTPVDATRPAPRGPVAIGFSVPAADDSPFAEFDISRGLPAGSTTDQEKTAASNGPAAASDPSPDRQPQPTQEQLLQDIQAEAAEKNAELKQRRVLKDRAREVIDAESQARVDDERAAFRRDLREAIKLSRKEAATQIDDLCNRYGRNYSDELRSKARFLLERYGGKMSREAKVRMLRFHGVPEAGILDFLANDIHFMINTRNGPRDSNEVRIDAAKQLLRIALVKDAGGASKGLPAQRVRPAASAASNSAPGNDQVP
ncbi:MAG: hypothetical protein JO114_21985 [Planctomycetaceae bacterium]|nr:hypothetical protein [Planctomycetaceae bacterium]MBV8311709.1 hypothetical protein [Planctomycetaceae bacterium]